MNIYAKATPFSQKLDPDEQELIVGWAKAIFGTMPLASQFTWTKGGAYRVVVYCNQQPVSYLKIIDRKGLLDEKPVKIGGVAGVQTPPEHRRKGYSGLALQETKRTIFNEMGAQLGLLLCEQELVPFYTRHGWQSVDCRVQFDQPSGKTVWPHHTMILAKSGESWNPKSIDLCGLPW
jgi:predicted acetyltransferase